jgi:hypothetical protein
MQVRIINIFHVSPQLFWERLFFDAEYNRGLYRALGFPQCDVQRQETQPDGKVRRVLRAVPPIHAPEPIRRRLEGRLYYLEDGTYDPKTGRWEFVNRPSVAADSTSISGVICAEPDPAGMRHVLELSVRVSAFGLGALIERVIENNTRASYRVTADYTNTFVQRPGFAALDGAARA